MATSKTEKVIKFFKTPERFEAWLDKHHTTDKEVWLQFYKKDSGVPSLNYAGALQVALCYGWIDGIANKLDEVSYIQRFTPRRPKSIWSKRNVEYVTALIKEGKMTAAGMAAIDAAKADGRWNAAY